MVNPPRTPRARCSFTIHSGGDMHELSAIAERLVAFAAPWRDAFSGSHVLPPTIVFVHLAALLVAGGFALATDRLTIRVSIDDALEQHRHLTDLARIHRIVVPALTIVALSGVLLFLGDVEAFIASPLFWMKAGLILLLLGNGLFMLRCERLLRHGESSPSRAPHAHTWRRLKLSAGTSVVLWFAILLAGTLLTNA